MQYINRISKCLSLKRCVNKISFLRLTGSLGLICTHCYIYLKQITNKLELLSKTNKLKCVVDTQ